MALIKHDVDFSAERKPLSIDVYYRDFAACLEGEGVEVEQAWSTWENMIYDAHNSYLQGKTSPFRFAKQPVVTEKWEDPWDRLMHVYEVPVESEWDGLDIGRVYKWTRKANAERQELAADDYLLIGHVAAYFMDKQPRIEPHSLKAAS